MEYTMVILFLVLGQPMQLEGWGPTNWKNGAECSVAKALTIAHLWSIPAPYPFMVLCAPTRRA